MKEKLKQQAVERELKEQQIIKDVLKVLKPFDKDIIGCCRVLTACLVKTCFKKRDSAKHLLFSYVQIMHHIGTELHKYVK